MSKSNDSLKAIHQRDLVEFLHTHGLGKKFEKNQLKCKFCRDSINPDNIYSLLRDGGSDIKVVCNKPECINSLVEYLHQKRRNTEHR